MPRAEELWEHPIGTGPFMFDSWDKGSQMVLKKNPSYWDEVKPYLDAVTFKVLTDSNARVLQLRVASSISPPTCRSTRSSR